MTGRTRGWSRPGIAVWPLGSGYVIGAIPGGLSLLLGVLIRRNLGGRKVEVVVDDTDARKARKQVDRAFRKGKISRTYYESEMRRIDKEITKREEESAKAYFESAFRNNPSAQLKQGDIVIRLTCPSCGRSGENAHGKMDFSVLGKDANGFLYFECPGCAKHLQYDPMTGTIKTQRGLLGFFFGIFR